MSKSVVPRSQKAWQYIVAQRSKKFLRLLESNPVQLVDRLVIGSLHYPTRSFTLAEAFSEIATTHRGQLDAGVMGWLSQKIVAPAPSHVRPVVWADKVTVLFQSIRMVSLPTVAVMLYDRREEFALWLMSLWYPDALDPYQAYLEALACSEANYRLEKFWATLPRYSVLETLEPLAYRKVALLGLEKSRTQAGKLQPEPTEVLINALLDLADPSLVPQADWSQTVLAIIKSSHSDLLYWQTRFAAALAKRKLAIGQEWSQQVFPGL